MLQQSFVQFQPSRHEGLNTQNQMLPSQISSLTRSFPSLGACILNHI